MEDIYVPTGEGIPWSEGEDMRGSVRNNEHFCWVACSSSTPRVVNMKTPGALTRLLIAMGEYPETNHSEKLVDRGNGSARHSVCIEKGTVDEFGREVNDENNPEYWVGDSRPRAEK